MREQRTQGGRRASAVALLAAALAVFAACGDGRRSATDAMEAGLCRQLATDADLESQVRYAVFLRRLDRGDADGALRMAREIPDYRRGVAIGRLAVEAACRGDIAAARELVREAERFAGGQFGWRRSRILGTVLGAKKGIGDAEEWEAAVGRLEAEDQAVARALWQRVRGALGDLAGALRELEAAPVSLADAPVRAEALLAAAEAASQQGGHARAAALARDAVQAVLAATGMSGSGAAVRKAAAVVSAQGGPIEEIRACVEAGAARARGLSVLAPWRAAELRRMASCLCALGDRSGAAQLLDAAMEGIAKLEPFFRPGARAQVAAGWWELGDTEKARGLWIEAAAEAAAHNHHRARAAGLIEVVGTMVEARCIPPPRIRELVAQTGRRFDAEFPEKASPPAGLLSGSPRGTGAVSVGDGTRTQ